MNAERLLAHYERIADAPDAVARLRRFILDLAVRGKLMPQDPKDESALELLKRIAAGKQRLVKAREAVSRDSGVVDADKAPFDIPANWAWTNIGEICSKTGSGSTPRGGKSAYGAEGIPFLRSQNVHDDGLRLDDVAYIDHQTHRRMEGTVVKPDDLLLNITGGSMGRCCLVPSSFSEANISQHVAIIRVALNGIQTFLHRLILSPYFQAYIFGEQTGAGRGGLPKNRMDRIPVALPPLAEQHRIVAKVDKLMALCDRLEAARAERETTRDRLAAACLDRLNAPDPDTDTFQHAARFALDALPVLTTRPDQIRPLRQTILSLAISGFLTADWRDSNPQSGDAAEIVARLEGAHMRNGGHRRGNAAAATEGAHDVDAKELPTSWRLTDLRAAVHPERPITYGILMPGPDIPKGIPYVRVADFPNDKINLRTIKRTTKEIEENYSRARLRNGDVLISIRGTIGRICVVPPELDGANITQDTARLSIQADLDPNFVVLFLRSPHAQRRMQNCSKGVAVRGINIGDVRALQLPIPPRAEQHRIVAKVEALMAVCDRLEASLTTGDDTRRRLLDALLHEALARGNDPVPAETARVGAHG
jgi:type I restriction enzyme S subunit